MDLVETMASPVSDSLTIETELDAYVTGRYLQANYHTSATTLRSKTTRIGGP